MHYVVLKCCFEVTRYIYYGIIGIGPTLLNLVFSDEYKARKITGLQSENMK